MNESAAMDPQGRLLLEQSSLALADAGGRLSEPVSAETGIYVGVMHMEYIQLMTGLYPSLCRPTVQTILLEAFS